MKLKDFLKHIHDIEPEGHDLKMFERPEDAYHYAAECDYIGIIPQQVYVNLMTSDGEEVSITKRYYMVVFRQPPEDDGYLY